MALPEQSSIDAQIIADQERTIYRLRGELATAESLAAEDFEHAVERFNPPDDDCTTTMSVLDIAADFIESVPCTCTPEQIEDLDCCARCRALGRRGDEPVAR